RRNRDYAGIRGGLDDAARASEDCRTIIKFFKEGRDASVGSMKVDYQIGPVTAQELAGTLQNLEFSPLHVNLYEIGRRERIFGQDAVQAPQRDAYLARRIGRRRSRARQFT